MEAIFNKDNAILFGVVVAGVLAAGGVMAALSGNSLVAKAKQGYN